MSKEKELNIKIKRAIESCTVEDDYMADNIAIVLCTYFENHMNRPENDPKDDDKGWSKWVISKYEKAMKLIVKDITEVVSPYVSKVELFGPEDLALVHRLSAASFTIEKTA